jgi:hypothetical protein
MELARNTENARLWRWLSSRSFERGTSTFLRCLYSMRFTVRKASKHWMVWDTHARTVALIDERPAIGLSENAAKIVADMLNSQDELDASDDGVKSK